MSPSPLFALWFTGLPGSGKSSIARIVASQTGAYYLELDDIRRLLVPHPRYDEEERAQVYRSFVVIAYVLQRAGHSVILDATAHRRSYRDFARSLLTNFHEVFVRCPLSLCMEREKRRTDGRIAHDLYGKALRGERNGIGLVIGIDVPFEENPHAEIILDSSRETAQALATQVLERLEHEGLYRRM